MPTLIKIDTLKKCIKLSYFVYGYSNAYFYSFELVDCLFTVKLQKVFYAVMKILAYKYFRLPCSCMLLSFMNRSN